LNYARQSGYVRNFLRLAQAGVYNGMGVHRVAKGFVIQTGYLPSSEPLSVSTAAGEKSQPEFNDTRHVKGRSRWLAARTPRADMSFFIVPRRVLLDGSIGIRPRRRWPAGRRGDRTGARQQEAPVTRIDVRRVTVEKIAPEAVCDCNVH
jgi:cyclophilin family peptidyl-prolyl cis-trans isomerase